MFFKIILVKRKIIFKTGAGNAHKTDFLTVLLYCKHNVRKELTQEPHFLKLSTMTKYFNSFSCSP